MEDVEDSEEPNECKCYKYEIQQSAREVIPEIGCYVLINREVYLIFSICMCIYNTTSIPQKLPHDLVDMSYNKC